MFGAVVVLYNSTNKEIQNINTYKNKVDYTVIVDNSSINQRDLIDSIVNLSENVIYYSEQKNLGLARGFNVGIDILIDKGCEWVLLFDADSKLETDIVSVYKKAIKKYKNNVAVFSPVHVFERSNNKWYKGYRQVEWAMTSGCLYNCEIFKKQNGFFEPLFVDGLDMDYCFKSNEIHLHSSKVGALGRLAFDGRKKCLFYTPHGYSFLMENQSMFKRNFFRLIEYLCTRKKVLH